MGLKEYKHKRDFNNTPEPAGEAAPTVGELNFVVQKHAASRLHYDFRLELDGVLKSWAVPKGPSLNPKDKRLAMEVEDHPLDYRHFEGVIPEGNYGAGNVIIWDKGTYSFPGSPDRQESEKQLRKGYQSGAIYFSLNGEKLKGEFVLTRIKKGVKNSWLLIKKKDEFARDSDVTAMDESVISHKKVDEVSSDSRDSDIHEPTILKTDLSNFPQTPMPKNVKPMLAELVSEAFDDPDWYFEVKWDGYRALAEIEDGNVNLYSRKNLSFNDHYPAVAEALRQMKNNALLDGEIVVLDKNGKSDFQLLQNYRRNAEGELVYYVFDLLYLDGFDLRDMPLRDRKDLLQKLLPENNGIVRFCGHIKEEGIAFFKAALEIGQEGIIAKNSRSLYKSGQRGGDWLKIKTHLRQEAVIAGFTEPRGTRKHFGALILGIYDENKELQYVGHAGGGFNETSLSLLHARLQRIIQQDTPFRKAPKTNSPVTWVKPELVCEVMFAEWTDIGQMRQPIFMGLREDKKPTEVTREKFAPNPAQQHTQPRPGKAKSKVLFSNQDKEFWPGENITKGDVITYYEKMCKYILPYLKDRPHSMLRHPNGIRGESFFQKDLKGIKPEWLQTIKLYSESNSREIEYLVCTDRDALLYMVNLGCIEINPWFSRIKKIENPDYLVIDLDPEGIGFEKVIETALTVKEVLDEAAADCFIKTSGATGLHIFVPLKAKYEFEIARNFAHLVCQIVHKRLPGFTSLERTPSKRKEKVYLDYLQNRIGQTLAAPYSIRPRPGAPVSTPLDWAEVKPGLNPRDFTMFNIKERLKEKGDIFKAILGKEINLVKSINNLEIAEKLL